MSTTKYKSLNDVNEAKPPISIKRIVTLAKPQWRLLSVGTIALLISSGMSLVYPQAVRWMIDAALEEKNFDAVDQAAGVLVVLFLVAAIFTALRAWLFTVAGERIVAALREQLFSAIIRQDVAFFDQSRTGELTNRLTADTAILQNTVTVNVSMALRYTVGAVGGLILLFWMSPTLAAIALAIIPFVALGSSRLGKLIRSLSKRVQDGLAEANTVAEEVISGIRTVRSFGAEPQETSRYGERIQSAYQIAAKRAGVLGIFHGVIGFMGYMTIAIVVWYGGRLVMMDEMSVGDLTAFLLYTGLVAMSLGALAGLYSDFMSAAGASHRVFALIDTEPDVERLGGMVPTDVKGEIVFKSVSFAYPSRPDVEVLTDLNLTLTPGKSVALVGQSGSGKSTIAALLARYYDPNGGSVLFDGVDLVTLDPKSLRRHIGAVSQEPILFATTIAENIRYANPGASLDAIAGAARTANAHDFIEAFPDGYQTLVGERGVRLSGGQKQRIAIARAVIDDTPILVLDEATSALDAESEYLVQEALERLMVGRTTLIIAHRLSTVKDADEVVVLEGGKVVERGTHDDLLKQRGAYLALVERQFGVGRESEEPDIGDTARKEPQSF